MKICKLKAKKRKKNDVEIVKGHRRMREKDVRKLRLKHGNISCNTRLFHICNIVFFWAFIVLGESTGNFVVIIMRSTHPSRAPATIAEPFVVSLSLKETSYKQMYHQCVNCDSKLSSQVLKERAWGELG